MEKIKGKNNCCTCSNLMKKKNENCDPCDICYRNEQYVESRIHCNECNDVECKFRQ